MEIFKIFFVDMFSFWVYFVGVPMELERATEKSGKGNFMAMIRNEFFNGELTKEKREMIINEVLEHHMLSLDLTYFFNASQLSEYDYRYFTIDEKANEVTYKYTYDINRLVTNVLMHQTQYNDDLVKDEKDVDLVVLLACLDLDNINDICLFSDGDLEALERMGIIETDEEEFDVDEYLDDLDDDTKVCLINDYLDSIRDYGNKIHGMCEINEYFSDRCASEIFEIARRETFFNIDDEYFRDDDIDLVSSDNLEDLFEFDNEEFKEFVMNHYKDYE